MTNIITDSDKQRMALFLKTVRENPYIKQKPSFKQAMFLMHDEIEGLLGGSAGPGKSSGLLMAALQYVQYSGYSAILLRRSFKDLSLPGALMDRAWEWLSDTDAHWDDITKTWQFPSGATLTFGYLEAERDKFRYQGSNFQFCGFDELSQFLESQYLYLFSRLRRLKNSEIPIRMRAASNPGDVGHDFVKSRFITYKGKDRFFVPATYLDNPHLDQKEYELALDKLDPITRAQLKEGNWDISFSSGMFRREWFDFVHDVPRGRTIRAWDMAATEQKDYSDADYTVGCLMTEFQGQFFIKDVVRFRKNPGDVEKLIQQVAEMDGKAVQIYAEQEPGSSGKIVIEDYARRVLKGYSFYGVKSTGDKVTRAQGLSAAASHHNVKIYSGIPIIPDILNEFVLFPMGRHDDIIDSVSMAFNQLSGNGDPNRFRNIISKKRRW
jgi:predicted phage terminase large subunit-like protein